MQTPAPPPPKREARNPRIETPETVTCGNPVFLSGYGYEGCTHLRVKFYNVGVEPEVQVYPTEGPPDFNTDPTTYYYEHQYTFAESMSLKVVVSCFDNDMSKAIRLFEVNTVIESIKPAAGGMVVALQANPTVAICPTIGGALSLVVRFPATNYLYANAVGVLWKKVGGRNVVVSHVTLPNVKGRPHWECRTREFCTPGTVYKAALYYFTSSDTRPITYYSSQYVCP